MMMTIEHARIDDLDMIKRLCDAHRVELGFVMRPSLEAAIKAKEVIVACDINSVERQCIGFVHYHHRRDTQTTIYHLVVHQGARMNGIGRSLILALRDEAHSYGKTLIRLKCPEPLNANFFYAKVGFEKVLIEAGKSRPLCIWEMAVT